APPPVGEVASVPRPAPAEPPVEVRRQPAPAARPAPPAPRTAAPAPAPAPPGAVPSDAPSVEQRDERLAAQRALLEIARTALARGHGAAALGALVRHGRRFPDGQLSEERGALLVQALVAVGDYARAREEAGRFRKHYPRSLLLPAVDQSLRSIP